MIKKILYGINIFLNRSLDIIAVLFLIMNFFIWYINDSDIDVNKYIIYQQLIYVLLGGLLINIYRFNPKTFIKDNIFFLLIFCLGLYNALSITMNFNGTIVDMGKRSEELILQAFPTFLIILAAYRQVHRKALVIGLSIVLLMIVGYSLLAILNEHKGLEIFLSYPIISNFDRHQSILNNSNVLGEYAFIGIFIAFFLSLVSVKFWHKLISLLPIPIFAYALILSGSRTALLMVIIFYVMINVYFMYYNKKNKLLIGLGNLILVIGVVLVLTGVFASFVDRIRAGMGLNGREQIWINTFSIINQNIFKGIGYNNFTYVYNEYFRSITSPHNMLLGIASEFGLFGLVLVISWFVYLFIRNHNTIIKIKNHPLTVYLIVFNAFYITYFIGQMFEFSFLKFSSINTLFLVLQAINFNVLDKIYEKKEDPIKISVVYLTTFIIFYLINLNFMSQSSGFYLYSIVFLLLLTLIIYGLKPIKNIIEERRLIE